MVRRQKVFGTTFPPALYKTWTFPTQYVQRHAPVGQAPPRDQVRDGPSSREFSRGLCLLRLEKSPCCGRVIRKVIGYAGGDGGCCMVSLALLLAPACLVTAAVTVDEQNEQGWIPCCCTLKGYFEYKISPPRPSRPVGYPVSTQEAQVFHELGVALQRVGRPGRQHRLRRRLGRHPPPDRDTPIRLLV